MLAENIDSLPDGSGRFFVRSTIVSRRISRRYPRLTNLSVDVDVADVIQRAAGTMQEGTAGQEHCHNLCENSRVNWLTTAT